MAEPRSLKRRVAIVVPARNEAGRIGACLRSLMAMPPDPRVVSMHIVVLANNCSDATAAEAAAVAVSRDDIEISEVVLSLMTAHAGGARRLGLDLAARRLAAPEDLLLTTDADTRVAQDWVSRTLDHVNAGADAVAGLVRFDPLELRGLGREHRRRLWLLRRYHAVVDSLLGSLDPEPAPSHRYEGGPSLALTLGRYRAIGGAPTPPVGEDKALLQAVRRSGGRVRHAVDVKVFTSPRLRGIAEGGAADTLARWCEQDEHAPLAGVAPLNVVFGQGAGLAEPLTLAGLPVEIAKARRLLALRRANGGVWQVAV